MSQFTCQIMGPTHLRIAAPPIDHAVADLILAEGPDDALVGFEGQRVQEKLQSSGGSRHALYVNPKEG